MPGLSQQLLLVCSLLGRSQAQADTVAFPSGGFGTAETPISLSNGSACTINPADATTGLMCWALGGARLRLHRGLNPGCLTRGFCRSPGGWGRPSLARCCCLLICRAERLPAAASVVPQLLAAGRYPAPIAPLLGSWPRGCCRSGVRAAGHWCAAAAAARCVRRSCRERRGIKQDRSSPLWMEEVSDYYLTPANSNWGLEAPL